MLPMDAMHPDQGAKPDWDGLAHKAESAMHDAVNRNDFQAATHAANVLQALYLKRLADRFAPFGECAPPSGQP